MLNNLNIKVKSSVLFLLVSGVFASNDKLSEKQSEELIARANKIIIWATNLETMLKEKGANEAAIPIGNARTELKRFKADLETAKTFEESQQAYAKLAEETIKLEMAKKH